MMIKKALLCDLKRLFSVLRGDDWRFFLLEQLKADDRGVNDKLNM